VNTRFSTRFVIIISAHAEWQAALQQIQPGKLTSSPYGDHSPIPSPILLSFLCTPAGVKYLRLEPVNLRSTDSAHSYWLTWVHAAGWKAWLSCGEILLVTETAFYDIYEGMSDYAQAVDFYRTKADLSWLPQNMPEDTRRHA